MSQSGRLRVTQGVLPPMVPIQFTTDSGIAIPALGNLNVFGVINAAGADPFSTSGVGDTLNINIQTSQAIAASNATNIGLAAFNSAQFTVDANGFVSTSGTGVANTITGNTGGALSPTAGNWNIVTANSTPIFAGSVSTLTQDFGITNLVLGSSLPSLTSGIRNVGVGQSALNATTSGFNNVAVGWNAGLVLADGQNDVFVGFNSGKAVTSGQLNTYVGSISGQLTTSGVGNTGIGYGALQNLLTGSRNICIANSSATGTNYTGAESDNIIIGSLGTTGDANTIRIGQQGSSTGQQNLCFIAGITGVTTSNTQMVTINSSTGQLGATATVALANGGTNASLVASNGGIFYSTATAGAILSGTATAGQMLRSGSNAAPTWSTATFPSTATSAGTILRADGTNWVATTATYPATTTINQILYSSSASVIGGITTANNGILSTNGSGVPSIGNSLTNDYTFTSSTAGGDRTLTVTNTDNTNGASNAFNIISVGGTSSGDAFTRYVIGTARSYAWGIDNSDSQAFKMVTINSALASPSSTNIVMRMDTTGNLALPLNACCTADLNTGLTNATGDGTFINPIIFDNDSGNFFDQNGNYNTTTGIFTANATGRYLVTARVDYNGLGASHTSGIVRIDVNGGTYAVNDFNPGASRNAANEFTASISCIVPVSATGTIAILGQVSGGTKTVGVKGNTSGSYTSVSIVLVS